MAILPLGTGNDISRTLNWGPGYAGEDLGPILNKARAAKPITMDRWKAEFRGVPQDAKVKESIMNAYLGVGIDAEIALKFHNLREEMPGLFRSRALNKLIYGHMGFTSMLTSHAPFHEIVKLELDGKAHPVPAGITGILLLNLPSWGGGTNPWGPADPTTAHVPQVIDDSTLEVIGLTGAFHLAQIQSGFQYGLRIAQAKSVVITTTVALPVQVDGEAWVLEPCSVHVNLHNKTKVLVYSTETYSAPVTTLDKRGRVEITQLADFKFSVEKLEAVRKAHHGNSLNKGEFGKVLNEITSLKFDEINPVLLDRLFIIFDTDKSGSVDFNELSVGLSVLGSGTLEKKLAFNFSLFDNGTGKLTKDQLLVAFRTLFSMLYTGESEGLVKLYVNILLEVYDVDKSNSITYDELLTACKHDSILAHLFTFGSATA